jgi:hypothetical protein
MFMFAPEAILGGPWMPPERLILETNTSNKRRNDAHQQIIEIGLVESPHSNGTPAGYNIKDFFVMDMDRDRNVEMIIRVMKLK